MADLATLQKYRDDLVAARFSGEAEITKFDGSKVRYRSVAEIDRALGAVDRDIAALMNTSRPSATRAALGDRG